MDRLQDLGAPIEIERPDYSDLDPTLDACCRRDEEDARRHATTLAALQRHDVVAKRNQVRTIMYEGCRCCYDPNKDGTEDYKALAELRARKQQQQQQQAVSSNDDTEENDHEDIETTDYKISNNTIHDDNNTSDSDSEFDYLLNDEVQEEESSRRLELERLLMEGQLAVAHGYGVHRQLHPMRILQAAGLASANSSQQQQYETAVVLHLVDPDSTASAQLDLYLEHFTTSQHYAARGTKFLRAIGKLTLLFNADLANKALPRLQPDSDMPALVAIRNGVVTSVMPKLQGLVDRNCDLVEHAVEDWLERAGVLNQSLPRQMCRIRPEEEALLDSMTTKKSSEEMFCCGVFGCEKPYKHEHVGVCNEQQSGVVVKEDQVLGIGEDV
jgi:hypothetical protein